MSYRTFTTWSMGFVLALAATFGDANAGTTRNWTNAAGNNNWFLSGNWSPTGVPATDDSLNVGLNSQRTPVANSPVTSDQGGISIRNSGALATFNQQLTIGSNGPGGLQIDQGGSVRSGFTVAGENSGSVGNLKVEDAGSTWTTQGTFVIGYAGSGNLDILEQADVTSEASTTLGDRNTGAGTAELRHSGTSWTVERALHIGKFGTGRVEVWEGAELRTDGAYLGEYENAEGTVLLGHTGTLWRSEDDIWVGGDEGGSAGVGDLTVGVSNTNSRLEVIYPTSIKGRLVIWDGTGALRGGGTVVAHVENRGTTGPGNSTGTLTIDGNFTQFSTGRLTMEVGGVLAGEYDVLQVIGSNTATLAGLLEIVPLPAYQDPAQQGDYDALAILTANSVVGNFDQVEYDGVSLAAQSDGSFRGYDSNGLFRSVSIGASGVQMTNYVALPGDANGDGVVDVSDYNIWNDNKFTSGTDWTTGDFNDDGLTDVSDYNIWNANKFTSAFGSVAGVPEPTSGALLVAVAAAMLLSPLTRRTSFGCGYARM